MLGGLTPFFIVRLHQKHWKNDDAWGSPLLNVIGSGDAFKGEASFKASK